MSDRWERPRRVRQAKRLSSGAIVVVAEYRTRDGAERETYYYTADGECWAKSLNEAARQEPLKE